MFATLCLLMNISKFENEYYMKKKISPVNDYSTADIHSPLSADRVVTATCCWTYLEAQSVLVFI